ncbi:hypothetical protein Prudu_016784, partial [Prunus dulcis]
LGDTQFIRAVNPGRIQGTIVSLIRWQVSVSGTQSQPSRKSWQVSGHQVSQVANPGTHGPSIPETPEAMSSALTEL